ncbi:MAG TPA: hypothetical protein VJJ82_01850 [Candidatus Nanoarchaeia archaeon]|nr:hypothetical protein [Candidatus Nanoarchaeia archaeon]
MADSNEPRTTYFIESKLPTNSDGRGYISLGMQQLREEAQRAPAGSYKK